MSISPNEGSSNHRRLQSTPSSSTDSSILPQHQQRKPPQNYLNYTLTAVPKSFKSKSRSKSSSSSSQSSRPLQDISLLPHHKDNVLGFNLQTISKTGSKSNSIVFEDDEFTESQTSSSLGLETRFLTYDRNQPPSSEIVDALFVKFLQNRAFDEQTKRNLANESVKRKWGLICLDFHSRFESEAAKKELSRKSYDLDWFLERTKSLSENELHRLERLLRGENFALVFLKRYGHSQLIRDLHLETGDFEFLLINCLKNCLNFDDGFEYFNEDLIVIRTMITIMVNSSKMLNKLNAVEVLLKLSDWNIPLGRNNILKAFHQLHQSPNLFQPWFESLRSHITDDLNILAITQNIVFMNYLAKSIKLMTLVLKNCESPNDQKIIHLKFKELDLYALFGKLREFNDKEINGQIENYKTLEVEIFSNEIINELNLGDTNLDLLLRNLRVKVGSNSNDELFQLLSNTLTCFLNIMSRQTKTESIKFFKLILNLVETISESSNYKTVSDIKGTDELIQNSIKSLMDKLSSDDVTKRALKELEEAEQRNESLALEIKSLQSATLNSSTSPVNLISEDYQSRIKEKDDEIEKLEVQVRELTYKNMNRGNTIRHLKPTQNHQSTLLKNLNRRSVSLSSAPISNTNSSAFEGSIDAMKNTLRSSKIIKTKSGFGLQAFLDPLSIPSQNDTSTDNFESIKQQQFDPQYSKPFHYHGPSGYLGSRQDSLVSSIISEVSVDNLNQRLKEEEKGYHQGMLANLRDGYNDSFESITNDFVPRFQYQAYPKACDLIESSHGYEKLEFNNSGNFNNSYVGSGYSSTVITDHLQTEVPFLPKRTVFYGSLSINSSSESVVIRKDQTINFRSNDATIRSDIDIPPPPKLPEFFIHSQPSSSSEISYLNSSSNNVPPPPAMPSFLEKKAISAEQQSSNLPPPPPPPPTLPPFLSKPPTSAERTSFSTCPSLESSNSVPLPPPPPPSLPDFLSNASASRSSKKPPPPPPPPPSLPGFLSNASASDSSKKPPLPPPLPELLRLNQSMPELGASVSKSNTPPPPPILPLFLLDNKTISIPPPPPPPPPAPTFPTSNKPVIKTHSKKLSEVLSPSDLEQITNSLKSNKKLKQLHWDKVDSVQDTIWETSRSVKVDELKELGIFSEIESLFTVKESGLKLNAMVKDSEKDGLISFVPRDLSQQFGINLHMFAGYSVPELVSLVLKCNYEVLENISVLEFFNKDELCTVPVTLMKKFEPYSTDYIRRNEPTEDPEKLERSDRIFLELCVNLQHYWRSRSRALLVIKTYERDYYDLLTKLQKVDDSVKAIRESENLKGLFLLIREIGNFMNRKSVEGFKLASLSKLCFIKDVGNQGTFLHYLERIIRRMYPEYISFLQELSLLSETAKINIDQLTLDVQSFTSQVRNIETSIKEGNLSDPSKFHPDDLVLTKLRPRLPEAIQKCEMLETQHKFILSDFTKLMRYFGENSQDSTSRNTFLLKLNDFLTDFKKVQVENFEREEKVKVQEKRRLIALESQKKSKELKLSKTKEEQESDVVFENLLKKLKSTKVGGEKRRVVSSTGQLMNNKDRIGSARENGEDNEIINRAQTLLKETQNIK